MNTLAIGSLAFHLYLTGRKSLSCCVVGMKSLIPSRLKGQELATPSSIPSRTSRSHPWRQLPVTRNSWTAVLWAIPMWLANARSAERFTRKHTCDVSGTITVQVHVLKSLNIDGPILFPLAEDLPFLARPLSETEKTKALAVARQ